MELSLETQLKPAHPNVPQTDGIEILRARLLAGLDRYLRAAGVHEDAFRHRLAARICSQLQTRGMDLVRIDWRVVIEAVDRALCSEYQIADPGGEGLNCKGRIAQAYCQRETTDPATLGALLEPADGWGTPLRSPKAMPDQELAPWRPRLPWLWQSAAWRPAQSVVVSFCCLAVVLVP